MVPNYLDVVRAVKQELIANGVDVDRDEVSRAEITFRAADRVQRRLDSSVGLFYKPQGNNVRERAVDIFCFPDGTIVDVLGAGPEGPNTPLWMVNPKKEDPSRWRMPFTYLDSEPLPAPPTPDVPTNAPPRGEPLPPLPPPTPVPDPPLSQPGGTVSVGTGLQGVLQVVGAWLGQQAVTAFVGWWSRRQQAPKATGSTARAVPRPPTPRRPV